MCGRHRLARAAVFGLILLPAAAGAQSRPVAGAAAPVLSEQDRADIRTLVARYARALGSCAADEYAGLFTPDGTFTTDEFRGAKHREIYGPRATLRGRDQLAQLVRTEEFCLDGKARSAASRPAPAVTIEPSAGRGARLGAARQRRPLRRRLREDGGRLALQEPRGDDAGAGAVARACGARPAASSRRATASGSTTATPAAGRTIVFVPGWTMSGEIWEPQLRAFSSRYRTVTLDPRAQGASEMTGEGLYLGRRGRDIGELLEHLNLTDVVLVGWSMGVREVITYVGTSGTSRVAALAFVEGNLWPQGALEPALENLRRMQADRKPFTRDFVKSMYVQPQTDAYIDRVTEMSLKTPTDAAAMLMFANAFGKDTDMRPAFRQARSVRCSSSACRRRNRRATRSRRPCRRRASSTSRAPGTRCSSIRRRSSTRMLEEFIARESSRADPSQSVLARKRPTVPTGEVRRIADVAAALVGRHLRDRRRRAASASASLRLTSRRQSDRAPCPWPSTAGRPAPDRSPPCRRQGTCRRSSGASRAP